MCFLRCRRVSLQLRGACEQRLWTEEREGKAAAGGSPAPCAVAAEAPDLEKTLESGEDAWSELACVCACVCVSVSVCVTRLGLQPPWHQSPGSP